MNIKNYDLRLEAILFVQKMIDEKEKDEDILERFMHYENQESLVQVIQRYLQFHKVVMQETNAIETKMKIYFTPFFRYQSIISSLYLHMRLYDLDDIIKSRNSFFQQLVEDVMDQTIDAHCAEQVINAIHQMDVANDIKLALLYLYSNVEVLWKKILALLKPIEDTIHKHFAIIAEDVNQYHKELTNNKELYVILNDILHTKYFENNDFTTHVTFVAYNEMRLIVDASLQKNHVYLGYLMLAMHALKGTNSLEDSKIQSTLKSLADATRFKIVKALISEKMYVQEIANHLGLTSATLVHHLEILLNEGLVDVVLDASDRKKIYYRTNKEGLKKFLLRLERNLLDEKIPHS